MQRDRTVGLRIPEEALGRNDEEEDDEMHPDGVDGDDGIFDSKDKQKEMEWSEICTSSNSSGCTETQSTNELNLFVRLLHRQHCIFFTFIKTLNLCLDWI